VGRSSPLFTSELYLWDRGRIQHLVTTTLLGAASINNAGQIAFKSFDSVFVLRDGQLVKVLGRGDSLFGRTVSSVGFGRSGQNDAGQLALNVTFVEWPGRTALIRVDPD
jgi:hypothetical protein